ncbi:MAG: sodium:solute symporter family protein [Sedimentisphaerales bacterium]
MIGLPIIDVVVIVIYFIAVLLIGIWASHRIKNREDYFLAGRRFGKFVQIFAAFGQATSVESAVGLTVLVARNGAAGIWQSITAVFGLPIYWITSVWYRRLRLLTLGDFFEERYGSKGLAGFYALISSVFFVVVIGLGFVAMTKTITGIVTKPVEKLSVVEKAEYERAVELQKLEETDSENLTLEQQRQLEQLRLENPRKEFSPINENFLMWVVAIVVLLYAIIGGLEAAFLVDTLQGVLIVILSVMLLPFAFQKVNDTFGGSGIMGVVETARARLPEAAFEIWGSPAMLDFTWYYLVALLVMSQINVAVQANQLTACGSAKDEYTARFGFTTGIYMKRACTLIWGVSALLLVILYSGIIKNPDYLWGYACRDLLGSLGFGLVGLMIASLMAALMSTVSALMITASSLLTHNLFRPLFPEANEKIYVWVGMCFCFIVIIGGVLIASQFDNVFQMLQLLWEFNIVLAAGFWLGMKWRRANRLGAWCSMISALVFFGLLPIIIPLIPGVKTNKYLLKTVEPITVIRTYNTRQVDVIKRQEEITQWNNLNVIGKSKDRCPAQLVVGQKFDTKYITPQKAIFWTQGLKIDENGQVRGSGMLSLELVIIDKMVYNLSKNPYALNETIRITIRTILPFLVLVLVSLFTKPDDGIRLDRFFVKMKTPANINKEDDAREIMLSYENPHRFDYRKMFRNSNWEFEKLDKTDIKGIAWFSVGGLVILLLLYVVVSIGK